MEKTTKTNKRKGGGQMEKVYVLDTSALIEDPEVFYRLGRALIVIPTAVIKELDGHKKSSDEWKARAARKVSRELAIIGEYKDLAEGAEHSTGGVFKVYPHYEPIDDLDSVADNRVVGAAMRLKRELGGQVTLISTDNNMRLVAVGHGLKARNWVPDYRRGNAPVTAPRKVEERPMGIAPACYSNRDAKGLGLAVAASIVVFIALLLFGGGQKHRKAGHRPTSAMSGIAVNQR